MIAERLKEIFTPKASAQNTPQWFIDILQGGQVSDSGIKVSADTAMTYSSVWEATNIISADVGQLPLNIFERTDDGREKATSHVAHRLMRKRPNIAMSAYVFRMVLQSHALLWGNGRALIIRNQRGEPDSLVPLFPNVTSTFVEDGQVWHKTRINNEERTYNDRDVLHIKGLGFDGITGHSVVSLAANSWGLGMVAEKYGGRFFKNDARPGIVLEVPDGVKKEDAQTLLTMWDKHHGGADNASKTGLLYGGAKATQLTMANSDAQWLETRAFQRVEVASWFLLPPHKLGDSSRLSYNSIEQEERAYLNMTLMRWLVGWQEECDEKLLTEKQKDDDSHYFEFNTSALLRGDLKTRYEAYQIGITSEFLSSNDVRQKENMNKREGGDSYINPNTKSAAVSSGAVDADNVNSLIEGIMSGRDCRGVAGPDGKMGADGVNGADGINGQPGPKGEDGKIIEIPELLKIEIVAKVRDAIASERMKVLKATKEASNFIGWIDTFYSRWTSLKDVVESYGADAQIHADYAADSKERLLDVSGIATIDTLFTEVVRETSGWQDRAYYIVDKIIASKYEENNE